MSITVTGAIAADAYDEERVRRFVLEKFIELRRQRRKTADIERDLEDAVAEYLSDLFGGKS